MENKEDIILKINKNKSLSEKISKIAEDVGISFCLGSLLLLTFFAISEKSPEVISKLFSFSKDKFQEFTIWLLKSVMGSLFLGMVFVVSPAFIKEIYYRIKDELMTKFGITEQDISKYNENNRVKAPKQK